MWLNALKYFFSQKYNPNSFIVHEHCIKFTEINSLFF